MEEVEKVLEAMSNKESIETCSDRGAKNRKGLHGIAMATKEETTAEMKATACGNDPGSFRMEANGMLARLRLLHKVRETWNTKIENGIDLCCNNEGLLKRAGKGIEDKMNRPRNYLMVEAN